MSEIKARYHFIDLLKAYAVIMMIQGHVIEAVLNNQDKSTVLYHFMHVLRGLTAPAFLMGAGFGLYFSFLKKSEKGAGYLIGQKVLRILPIIAVGYFLHLPYFSAVRVFFSLTSDEWARFLQCDILQTIGYTILFFQILFVAVRKRSVIAATAVGFTALVLIVTPAIQQHARLPLILNQLVVPGKGSPFPLFPFAAYLLLGVALGYGFMMFAQRSRVQQAGIAFMITGIALFAIAHTVREMNSYLFLWRSGILTCMCGGLILMEMMESKLKDSLVKIGQESFIIYYVHVMIVYGSVVNKGFSHYLGARLNTLQSVFLALVLITVMIMIALGWSWLKTKDRQFSIVLRNALAAGMIFTFLIGR